MSEDQFSWFIIYVIFLGPQVAFLFGIGCQMWSERKERQRIEGILGKRDQ